MLITDGDDTVLRIRGVEYARITPANVQIAGTFAQVEAAITAYLSPLVTPEGYDAYVHLWSKTPVDYRICLAPLGTVLPADWWDKI
jgi:hypothetical protein